MDENNKHIFEGMDVKNEDDMNIVKKKNKIENILKNEDNADFVIIVEDHRMSSGSCCMLEGCSSKSKTS